MDSKNLKSAFDKGMIQSECPVYSSVGVHELQNVLNFDLL
jgi:hypothetical protein